MTPVLLPKLTFKCRHDPGLPLGPYSTYTVPLGDVIPLICKHLCTDDAQIYNTSPDFFPVPQFQKLYASSLNPLVNITVWRRF